MSFYSELKRRNVLRVAAGYIVSSWLLIQVAETIFPLFGFGDGPARIVVILLVIGLFPTLIVAWIFELTPGGLRKDEDVDRSPASFADSTKRFDRIIMLVLALAVSYFAFDKFVLSESRERIIAESARETGMFEALAAYAGNTSIAVLPFADMSAEQDQEYFADGVTEELINELAKLEGLNVTGRTSSFALKGHNQDLRSIGEQLSVTHILEGSVRKDGDNLRIAAELINAQTGFQLWSEAYDNKKIVDIFYIQEDIARSVAGALSIALEVEGRNHLPGTGTSDVEAYDAYLKGRALAEAGKSEQAAVFYERAIDIDADYAEAWAGLGLTVALSSWFVPLEEAREVQERGRQLVAHAVELDPDFAHGYSMLGDFQWARGDWIGATEYKQAYSALTPADIVARMGNANILGKTGRLRAALKVDEMTRLIDPLSYFAATINAEHQIQVGNYDDARAAIARIARLSSDTDQAVELRRLLLAISEGELDSIRDTLENYAKADSRVASIVSTVLEAFDSPTPEILPVLHRLRDGGPEMTGEGRLITASLAAHFGDPELALDIMTKELSGNLVRTGRIWYPFFSDMRKLPGFKILADKIGLVAYWRSYGWADVCRPIGGDDFACE